MHINTATSSPNNSAIIWRLVDGKSGHDNQSLGLVQALAKKMPCQHFDIPVQGNIEPLLHYLTAAWPFGNNLPQPDFIIGAGHRTHLHLLAAQKAHGGNTIVLMQPSLPVAWFDLCVIPEHDDYQGNGDILETRGVLNTVNSDGEHHAHKALMMVGGHSRHCEWQSDDLITQISTLVAQNPHIEYTLTTSRRTPKDFLTGLRNKLADNLLSGNLSPSNLSIVPFEQTTSGWVKTQLAASATAWITEDSVSMIYESLTAQVAVGLLNLPIKQQNRITRGVEKLVAQRLVTRFSADGAYKNALHPVLGFVEAERCAEQIIKAWASNPQRTGQPRFANI